MSTIITLSVLCQLEPGIRDLEAEAGDIEAGHNFCANAVWYAPGGLKSKISRLVGTEGCLSNNPFLHNSEAYDVVAQHLWEILPPCNHAGCCVV